ncbi:Protein of unknown function [Lactobacillus helveticus CIRM-BIA 101]|nr:Protein of unknown function [Lactobacillus helveticus CIRM-BIA 103]CDI65023.1 Protein of unknown function [Lactobacillus helveticus CIRM-BIA 101]
MIELLKLAKKFMKNMV